MNTKEPGFVKRFGTILALLGHTMDLFMKFFNSCAVGFRVYRHFPLEAMRAKRVSWHDVDANECAPINREKRNRINVTQALTFAYILNFTY